MTLEQLSTEVANTTGNPLGFVIKSQATGRKFRVCYKLASGKFAITRLDDGKDYLVNGTENRYDFDVPIARIREAKAELAELIEQKAVLDARMTELNGVLEGVG